MYYIFVLVLWKPLSKAKAECLPDSQKISKIDVDLMGVA